MRVIYCNACQKIVGSSFTPPKAELTKMLQETAKRSKGRDNMIATALLSFMPMLPEGIGEEVSVVVRFYCPECTTEIATRALEGIDSDESSRTLARDTLAAIAGEHERRYGEHGGAAAGYPARADGERASAGSDGGAGSSGRGHGTADNARPAGRSE